jgi:hypothetical protein
LIKGNDEVTTETTKVVVTVPGGIDPNNNTIRLFLEGTPQFETGEEVLLFLIKHKGQYQVQHWALGAFHQQTDAEGTPFATRGADEQNQGQRRNLSQFKSWIRTVLSGKRNVEKNYYALPSGELSSIRSRYNLFKYGNFNPRWFNFDNGGSITWAVNGQQAGLTNGNFILRLFIDFFRWKQRTRPSHGRLE